MHQSIDYRSIAQQLIERGYTTQSIAKAIGVSQPSVSRLGSGKTAALGADAAVRLIVLAGGRVQLPNGDWFTDVGDEPAQGGAGRLTEADLDAHIAAKRETRAGHAA